MNNTRTASEIAEEFGLGQYLSQEPIGRAGRGVLALTTKSGRFVLKPMGDAASAALYAEVERQLNAEGVRQPRIFQKPDGSLISTRGYAAFEFVKGTSCEDLIPARLHSAMAYIAAFHAALARLRVPPGLSDRKDPWSRAASIHFLIDELPKRIDDLDLRTTQRAIAKSCLDFLKERREAFERSAQLVHSDIGPDNILFLGDEVATIIDFTPHVAPELFALCQFFYWSFLWKMDIRSAEEAVRKSLAIYSENRPEFLIAEGALHATLVWAAAFRLFGPLLAMDAGLASYSASGIEVRASLLKGIMESEPFNFSSGL